MQQSEDFAAADGAAVRSGRSRARRSSSGAPSFLTRRLIGNCPSDLMRALVATPRRSRDESITAWVEAEVQQSEQDATIAWIHDNRESLLAIAIADFIGLRESWAERNRAADAVVARLNRVFDECRDAC